jgi:hypothetical protein
MEQTRVFAASIMMFRGKSQKSFLLPFEGKHEKHKKARERIQQIDARPHYKGNGAAPHRQVREKGGANLIGGLLSGRLGQALIQELSG